MKFFENRAIYTFIFFITLGQFLPFTHVEAESSTVLNETFLETDSGSLPTPWIESNEMNFQTTTSDGNTWAPWYIEQANNALAFTCERLPDGSLPTLSKLSARIPLAHPIGYTESSFRFSYTPHQDERIVHEIGLMDESSGFSTYGDESYLAVPRPVNGINLFLIKSNSYELSSQIHILVYKDGVRTVYTPSNYKLPFQMKYGGKYWFDVSISQDGVVQVNASSSSQMYRAVITIPVDQLPTPSSDTFIINPVEGCVADATLPKFTQYFDDIKVIGESITATHATSSLAFFPGIMGSRLYRPGNNGGEDKLWESVRWKDVEELGMTASGTSMRNDVYTRDIIDVIRPLTGWWDYAKGYDDWITFLDTLVSTGALPAWRAIPYDWRLATNYLPQLGSLDGNNVSYLSGNQGVSFMVDTLDKLADASPSGKVTIVAHSNGGLVVKNLLQYLENTHNPLLAKIDTVVLVATPQLGTPKAVGEILHGTVQPVEKTVREITERMPGALGLLPSRSFFVGLTNPVVSFSSRVGNISGYASVASTTITTFDGLRSFLLGLAPVRSKPASNNLNIPDVLDQHLLDTASAMHDGIDAWEAPAGIKVIELAGTGLDTPNGIIYSDCARQHCPATNANYLTHEWVMTTEGDGTVVTRSADGGRADETYYIALDAANLDNARNDDHGTILSVPQVQQFILNDILGGDTSVPLHMGTNLSHAASYPRFELRAYSPVDLHLYRDGTHTGVTNDPATDLGRTYDTQLENSYYDEWGEVKYAGADLSRGPVQAVVKGTGAGEFTLELDTFHGAVLMHHYVFGPVSVGTTSRGTMTVADDGTPVLAYDYDGDGTVDVTIHNGESYLQYPATFDGLRAAIRAAQFPVGIERWLLDRVTLAESLYGKGVKGTVNAALVMLRTLLADVAKNATAVSAGDVTRIQTLVAALVKAL